jgi:hypothetical protein
VRCNDLEDGLRLAFRLAGEACRKLEAEPPLNGVLFNYDEADITFLDRLSTPNTPDVFENLRGDLQAFAGGWYQTDAVRVESVELDPRKCLTIHIAAARESVVE